jgi:putative multiple sugar transport system ATP-binding protein
MVGREMADRYPKRTPNVGEVVFELRDWHVHHPLHATREVVKGVNLSVRRGEIVGIAGLMGAGRTELAMSLFGRAYGQRISGEVLKNGRLIDTSTIDRAIAQGIAYVTEDRKGLGLVLHDDIRRNITLANLSAVSKRGVIDGGREHTVAVDYRRKLNIRSAGVHQAVVDLSGGNQQKVVLSKWLFAEPELLILDEPTRGIDVGAKYEMYGIMNALADQGKAIMMISSELPELLGTCDRIYTVSQGAITGCLTVADATQESLMRLMTLIPNTTLNAA